MTCRPLHLCFIALMAAVACLSQPGSAARAAEPHTSGPCLERGADPEQPLCARPEGRVGPVRADLRQPAPKGCLVPAGPPLAAPVGASGPRPGAGPASLSRSRLHVLLCTWLT